MRAAGSVRNRSCRERDRQRVRGFTLIELLIVVAIISILAAIAIPNYLEAQIRAKVAKAQGEMRTLGTAIEAYRVDNVAYPFATFPPNNDSGWLYFNDRLIPLTTPVSYLASLPMDLFQVGENQQYYGREPDRMYDYTDRASTDDIRPWFWSDVAKAVEWRLASVGPDKTEEGYLEPPIRAYDSSNGTVSRGDIFRFGP